MIKSLKEDKKKPKLFTLQDLTFLGLTDHYEEFLERNLIAKEPKDD